MSFIFKTNLQKIFKFVDKSFEFRNRKKNSNFKRSRPMMLEAKTDDFSAQ